MSNSITEEMLATVQCYDYSLQKHPKSGDMLILMCKTAAGMNLLNDIINSNAFDLKVFIEEKTGDYSLVFEFIDTDLAFRLSTGRNEITYPPVVKLKNNSVKFITTGVWGEDSPQGRMCTYHPRIFRFGVFDIGKSFEQAERVRFVANRSQEEPAMVILIYRDWDHIFESEADDAYNKLEEKTLSNPLLGIHLINETTVNLRIWDILVDLDIRFNNLAYENDELQCFLAAVKTDYSFCFALGFPLEGSIASTKRDDFNITVLRGYSQK